MLLIAKAFIVARQKELVEPFCWNPRSVNIHAEVSIVLIPEVLGAQFLEDFSSKLNAKTYQVELDERNDLRWVDRSAEPPKYFSKEPDTSWWQRFSVGFMKLLPGKGQL